MQVIKSGSIATIIEQTSRSFTDGNVDVWVRDEITSGSNISVVAATYLNGILTMTLDFNAVEGRYYYVIVSQSNNELVKFKMFCTDQTDLQDYLITDGDFTTAPTSNDTIIVA